MTRLTLHDLLDLVMRAEAVIAYDDKHHEHGALRVELDAVAILCKDAIVTQGHADVIDLDPHRIRLTYQRFLDRAGMDILVSGADHETRAALGRRMDRILITESMFHRTNVMPHPFHPLAQNAEICSTCGVNLHHHPVYMAHPARGTT